QKCHNRWKGLYTLHTLHVPSMSVSKQHSFGGIQSHGGFMHEVTRATFAIGKYINVEVVQTRTMPVAAFYFLGMIILAIALAVVGFDAKSIAIVITSIGAAVFGVSKVV
ncbi:unnamed protein product, partial [Meganyctiphanes norvegica]